MLRIKIFGQKESLIPDDKNAQVNLDDIQKALGERTVLAMQDGETLAELIQRSNNLEGKYIATLESGVAVLRQV